MIKIVLKENQEDRISDETKIHAIISDPKGNRKIGKKIDFRMDNNQRYFNPTIEVQQLIEIAVRKNKDNYELVYLQVDKKDSSNKLDTIAVNEGFEKVQSFLEWVYNLADEKPKDTLSVLRGKILHWTNIEY